MVNQRIANWIDAQRRMVGPHAVSVCTVVLAGPDGDAWGTWSIEQDKLDEAIDAVLSDLAEGLAVGIYACNLIGLDANNNQIAKLPYRLHGKAQAAIGAGGEAHSLQRATGVAVSTLEQIIGIQGASFARLSELAESYAEDRSILIELLNKLETQNVERDLAVRDYERRAEREASILKILQESGVPLLNHFANSYAEKQEEAKAQRKKQRELAQGVWPPGYAEMAAQTGQPLNGGRPAPTVKAPPSPAPASDVPSRASITDELRADWKSREPETGGTSPRARRDEATETPQDAPSSAPPVVQAEGFAVPADQSGASQTPGNEPTPATPARGSTDSSPSATLKPDVPDNQSPDRADSARRTTAAGVEAVSAGGRKRSRQSRTAGGGRKSTKRRAQRGT